MKSISIIGVLLTAIIIITTSMTVVKSDETIVISRTSTQSDLDSLTKVLESKGVELRLNEAAFNDQGHLESVSGAIHFSRFSHGTFSTNKLDKIIIEKGVGTLSIEVNEVD